MAEADPVSLCYKGRCGGMNDILSRMDRDLKEQCKKSGGEWSGKFTISHPKNCSVPVSLDEWNENKEKSDSVVPDERQNPRSKTEKQK